MVKICTICKEELEIENFAVKNKAKGKYSSECKVCHRKMRNAYYVNNTEVEKERVKKTKAEYSNWYKELKSQLKCNRCPESHVSTLHFHHTNPDEKEFTIARSVRRGWAKERILEEIAKCEVLCANCHCKEHHRE